MGSDVVLTAALRTNLLSLQNTQSLIDKTQERLATGLRVNSALDNPQSFFAAQALDNRAGDLGRLLDGIGQSIRTIEEADNGITGLSTLVDQADSIAQAALSEIRSAQGFAQIVGTTDLVSLGSNLVDGTIIGNGANDQFNISVTTFTSAGVPTTETLAADINLAAGDTVDNIVAAINADTNIGAGDTANGASIRASVTSNGQLKIESLVEGAVIRFNEGAANSVDAAGFARLGLDQVVATENDTVANGGSRQSGSVVAGRVVKSAVSGVAANGTTGLYEASADLINAYGFTAGDTINLRLVVDGQSTSDIALVATGGTIQDVIDGINNSGQGVNNDGPVTASFNETTGQIELEVSDSVGQLEVEVRATAIGDTAAFGFGTGASDLAAAAAAADIQSENFTFVGSSANLNQFQDDFNNVRTQIDGLVEDASYQGINLLQGDNLVTTFNEDASNELVTDGVDFSALGLGIDEAAFSDVASVQTSIDDIFSARQQVRNFGSSIANDLAIIQTRQEFTFQTINTLEAGRDDLVVADQNEEGANLLALQTRQALGVTALSLASQSAQSVLQLF